MMYKINTSAILNIYYKITRNILSNIVTSYPLILIKIQKYKLKN